MGLAAFGDVLETVLAAGTPRAPVFIVTIYGDAVEPRGGTLWMGDLVACCAAQGISESLVRTAVSRLVAGGKLLGERIGRKSYYRLTDETQAEFREASQVLYAPPPPASGWLIALQPGEALAPGWAPMGQGSAIAPAREDIVHPGGPVLSAETLKNPEGLRAYAGDRWELETVADRYRRFLVRFEGLGKRLARGTGSLDLSGELALALRLQLVHHYRLAALKDPRLPRAAWPQDWPAEAARRLFVEAYLALAKPADDHIGRTFHDARGLLPPVTEATMMRLNRLGRETVA
ncbi:ArsR family transcriptional regulator [Rhodobacterales bacterium]|nr:ArsR family transcriptional regulator [Rhodobacterales bacterium]